MKSFSSRRYTEDRTNDRDIPQDANSGSHKKEVSTRCPAISTTWDIEPEGEL